MKVRLSHVGTRALVFSFVWLWVGSFVGVGLAEVSTQAWVARYDGDNKHDHPSKMVTDAAGNVYVTGYICRTGSSSTNFCGQSANADYATVKYDPSGNLLWTARYDNGKDDTAASVAVDGSGNVYVTGTSDDPSIGFDYTTIKYDSSGNQLWVARYRSGAFSRAIALAVDSSGNVYVTGHSRNAGVDENYNTVKYDSGGQQLWVAIYDHAGGLDAPSAIAVDPAGNVYVTGTSYQSTSYSNSDYATLKYDAAGNQLWVARHDRGAQDGARALTIDSQGNVYATGGSSIGAGSVTDYATVKYDAAGNLIWEARYDHGSYDSAAALAL